MMTSASNATGDVFCPEGDDAVPSNPVPVTLDNALWSVPFKLPGRRSLHGVQVQAQAAALDGITANSVLTAGTWPAQSPAGQPIQVAVPTSTAAALGLTAGGLLTLPNSYTGAPVRMRVTLSYFIEPSPTRRGWRRRYRYASHQLRFELQGATETNEEFRKRLIVCS